MRRKTDKDILKASAGIILLSVIFILSGIVVMILPYSSFYPEYSSLQTKEVKISEFEVRREYSLVILYRSARLEKYDVAYIHTTDGETYSIGGKHDKEQLKEVLTDGKTVTIKWSKVLKVPVSELIIEEIYLDGEKIVTYDNDLVREESKDIWKFAIWPIALGIGGLLYVRWNLKHNREIQRKRDERIKRKYGAVKK